jgi:hypothetical protein
MEKALEEIQKEIDSFKQDEEFEIEVEEKAQEEVAEQPEEPEHSSEEQESEGEYSAKVQKRIKKLVDQRREAELEARSYQEQMAQLQSRLERLEQGNTHRAENEFNQRYEQTKAALTQAVENGDTQAQVEFSEQLADMRAAMRVAELQRQVQSQQSASPTVGRAQQAASAPAPEKAMSWWEKNRWFNSSGFERETAAARAIDVQLDLEGYDKNSDEYYEMLDNRLQNVFPELKSDQSKPAPKAKSRAPVAPTAGGSQRAYKGNRVRLTQDQLRMARELGITDEKGLKQYEREIRNQQRN